MPQDVNSMTDAAKQVVESTSLPAGITVSSFTLLGVPLSDWVFMGTAFLLVCKLIITVPEAYRFIKRTVKACAQSKRRK